MPLLSPGSILLGEIQGSALPIASEPENIQGFRTGGRGKAGGAQHLLSNREFPSLADEVHSGFRFTSMGISEAVRILSDGARQIIQDYSGMGPGLLSVSFNTGSEVPLDLLHPSGDNVYPVKLIENLLAARRKIQEADLGKRLCVVVVGGGTAAVEEVRTDCKPSADSRLFRGGIGALRERCRGGNPLCSWRGIWGSGQLC